MKTPYEVLEVDPTATQAEIKRAYRKKAREQHPDHNPGKEEAFKETSMAYAVLASPASRKRYDETGSGQALDLKTEAMSHLIQAVSERIAQGTSDAIFYTDIFRDVEKKFTMMGKTELTKIRNIKTQAKRVDKIIAKIRHKDGENSFVIRALLTQKREMLSMIRPAKNSIRILRLARKMAREYSFEVDFKVRDNFGLLGGTNLPKKPWIFENMT